MKTLYFRFIILIFITSSISCNYKTPVWTKGNNTGIDIDGLSDVEKLNIALSDILVPLSGNPSEWTDEQLACLDVFHNKGIVGLGEATHGTSEFFKAKHRIFKYLVENHGFKVFVMEADFGESLLINNAIWEGKTADIKGLMTEHMHFWTWYTEEVQTLLEWMSEYNKGKPEEDRIIYMGNDCQTNDKNAQLVADYLIKYNNSLYEQSKSILNRLKSMSYSYDSEAVYQSLLSDVENLEVLFNNNKNLLIAASNSNYFDLYARIITIMKQVVSYTHAYNNNLLTNRDQNMAENSVWISNHLNEKIVVWAHNGHIADNPSFTNGNGGSMGNHLKQLTSDYANLGFSFSNGWFTSMTFNNELTSFEIKAPPYNSLNDVFSRTHKTFFVEIDKLSVNEDWNKYFSADNNFISIGSRFSSYWLASYYYTASFSKSYFDYMIHIDKSSPSKLL